MADLVTHPADRVRHRVVVVEVELPDYNVDGLETDEDVEVAMDLANHLVTVTFATHEGDNPGVVLRAMEGRVTNVKLVDCDKR